MFCSAKYTHHTFTPIINIIKLQQQQTNIQVKRTMPVLWCCRPDWFMENMGSLLRTSAGKVWLGSNDASLYQVWLQRAQRFRSQTVIEIPNVHSDLEHSNLIFSHSTLAHDDTPCQVWLQSIERFFRYCPHKTQAHRRMVRVMPICLPFKKLSYGGTMNKETGPWKVSLTASNAVNITNLPFCVQRHGVMTFPIFRPIKAQKSKQRPCQHKPLRKHTTKSRLTCHNMFVCLTCLMLTLCVWGGLAL